MFRINKLTALVIVIAITLVLFTSCKDNNVGSQIDSSFSNLSTDDTTDVFTTVRDEEPDDYDDYDIYTTVKTSQIPDICTSRYGYYQLNADEKFVYEQIVDAALKFKPSVKITRDITREQIKRICKILYLEENDLYYLAHQYELSYTNSSQIVDEIFLTYSYDKQTVESMNQRLDVEIKKILDKTNSHMSTFQKIKMFHDSIVYTCVYNDSSASMSSAYGALVEGKAVCEGYSRAFAMLCNKMGIENLFATGTVIRGGVSSEEHMWNMVRINGEWYNMDVTSDDPNPDEKNDDGEKVSLPYDYIQYNYFLFPTSQLNIDGNKLKIDDSVYDIPQATSMEENYFVKYGLYAHSYEQGINILTSAIDKAVENKYSYVRIKFEKKEDYDKALDLLFGRETLGIFKLQTQNKYPNNIKFTRSTELRTIQLTLVYDE